MKKQEQHGQDGLGGQGTVDGLPAWAVNSG